MIEAILPAVAAVAEAREDSGAADLFAAERALIGRAVEKRRREFATGRACAHRALAQLGLEPVAIGAGERGEPLWPDGVVGSITHCRGYRGCAVARAADLASLGIDAEPHEPLPAGLIGDLAGAPERAMLEELGGAEAAVHWDRLLFSAKESAYKAWFPLTGRWLGFEDAVLSIDPAGGFRVRLLVPGPSVDGTRLDGFDGRWTLAGGLLLTAVAVSR